jgi:hypothetical protein
MKQKFAAVLVAVSGLLVAPSAFAQSVLSTEMSSAVSSAMDSLKDTVGDLVTMVLPIIIGVAVFLAVPGIVKKFIAMVAPRG